jgi:hypothetical protein
LLIYLEEEEEEMRWNLPSLVLLRLLPKASYLRHALPLSFSTANSQHLSSLLLSRVSRFHIIEVVGWYGMAQ